MKRVIIIDNDDSFTYNLKQLISNSSIGVEEVVVVSHQTVTLEEIVSFTHIIFSPGPSLPKDRPKMYEILEHYESSKVILGVCLGHQAIGSFYGAPLVQLKEVVHGQQKMIYWNNQEKCRLTTKENTMVGLYHSWYVEQFNPLMPIIVSAKDEQGRIMAIEHKEYNVFGVQFHPESIMTTQGQEMIDHWLSLG
ncbi:aminodeoxychorismate/anthranilate synthase component II [Halosquirtibacter laminarini]|uniref:Aminodeoxychorismate/anthranilate synthase component II n=1 Tax=Halosquirtibacter laminarini TaxID=3374600 RepID=A0AC61NDL6_9BACT|nr:aminodeoxychorismate/anthranilate synthase component II [Prolixibacteraceae bacterium]